MRRLARAAGWGLAGIAILLIAATIHTARSGDPALWPPAPGMRTVEIQFVSHGYHSGIALPRTAVAEAAGREGYAALIAVTQRFAAYPWIEAGWGDEGFYRSVPDAASLTMPLALRALFQPGNASVMHVVGLSDPPPQIFRSSAIVSIRLSQEGFTRLLALLDAGFAKAASQPEELGKGLYGPSLFYRGTDAFHIFNVCNHWVARLLSAAGLPTAPVLATHPHGLMFDLRWRSGLVPLALGGNYLPE